ncbi:unnamed protein product [Musa hybrid cultivar]
MLNEECLRRTCPCGELCSNQQGSINETFTPDEG